MPRSCTVCCSPDLAAITKAVARGGSNRVVADRFDVTTSAVQRHRVRCMAQPRKQKTPADIPEQTKRSEPVRFDSENPASLISTTARLVDEALDLLEHAKRDDDRKVALAALREARDGLQLLMRARGMLADATAGNTYVDQRKQVVAVLGKLSEADLRAIARGQEPESVAALKT